MLLLVPAQKPDDDGSTNSHQQQQPNSTFLSLSSSPSYPSTSTKRRPSGTISSTSGRVLVFLPSQTDLTSKLAVSDSAVLTPTSFLPSSHHYLAHSDGQEHGGGRSGSGYRSQGNGNGNGGQSRMARSFGSDFDSIGMDGRRRHSSSSPLSSSSTMPLSQQLSYVETLLNGGATSAFGDTHSDLLSRRRHSHLGLTLSSGMDPDKVARLRSSGGGRRRSRSRSRASIASNPHHHHTSISAHITTRNASATTTRSFREAFKKSMTVHSPLLTSTSSGMVLDLSPGPEPNVSRSGNHRGVGGESEARVGMALNVPSTTSTTDKDDEKNSPESHCEDVERRKKSRKRSQEEMVDFGSDGIGSKSEPTDIVNIGPGGSSRQQSCDSPLMPQRGLGLDDAATIPTFDSLSVLVPHHADPGLPPCKRAAIVSSSSSSASTSSCVTRNGSVSVSVLSTASSQSPPSRSPSPPPVLPSSSMTSPSLSSPTPALAQVPVATTSRTQEQHQRHYRHQRQEHHHPHHHGQDIVEELVVAVVTTQDISAMTASMGALTPLEIQRRLYAQQEKQQKMRKRQHLQQQKQLLLQHQQQQREQSVRASMVSHHHPSNYQHQPNFRPNSSYHYLQIQSIQSQTQTQIQNQQYRGIVGGLGGNHIGRGTATIDPLARMSPYHQYPPQAHHSQAQDHQAQARQPQTRDPPLVPHLSHPTSSSASALHPMHHPLYSQHQQQQQQQQLPSCYYLPPSAFRMASAVAAEEQLEAEQWRKQKEALEVEAKEVEERGGGKERVRSTTDDNEKEEDEAEEDQFLIFPYPSLSQA